MLAAVTLLVATGTLTITEQILTWTRPPVAAPGPPLVGDLEFTGAATVAAVDYLSWDTASRAARQAAMNRASARNITIDGWDGTGKQWADSPAPIGLARVGTDRAVVTVRVRVIPFTPVDPAGVAATPPSTDVAPNTAAAPGAAAGWTAQPARWVNLAVPLALQDGRIVVTTRPVPVGTPPKDAHPGAAVTGTSTGDAAFAQSTRDTVTALLRSYGTGDLGYARASGTGFSGLDKAAVLDSLGDWRVAAVADDQDPAVRVGDATVTWVFSGGAGKVTATYRVELRRQDDRWYLASISAESEEPT